MGIVDSLKSITGREEKLEKEETKMAQENEDAEEHTVAAAKKLADAMSSMKRGTDKEAFANMAMALGHLHISEMELNDEAKEAAGVGREAKNLLEEEESIEKAVDTKAQENGWDARKLEQAAEELRNNRSVPSPSPEQIEQLYRKYA